MFCTKCGKEIPDGESKICDECEKQIVNSIMAEEKELEDINPVKEEKPKKEKVSKKKAKEEVKEVEEKKEEAEKGDWKVSDKKVKEKSINSKSAIVVILFVVAILVCGAAAIFFLSQNGTLPSVSTSDDGIGNTVGNIRNYGYAVEDGGWIYYLVPNSDSTKIELCKIKNNGKNKELLYTCEHDIISLNAVGDYLYFIGISLTPYSETDEIDNKIYRIKKDGSELKVINDNELNNDCYEIYVINDVVYYIGVNSEVCTMKTDGSDKKIVTNFGTGYLGVTENNVIYNYYLEETDEYVTYVMNNDGSDQKPAVEGRRMYNLNVEGDYLYYSGEEKGVYRTKIGSGQEEVLYENIEAYNLNTDGKYGYYLYYLDPEGTDPEKEDYAVCIYRVKLDGSSETPEMIKQLESYSSYIDLVGDWMIYMDSDDYSGFINLVKKNDGEEVVQLFHLNYEEYYKSTTDYSDVSVDSGSTDTETVPEEVETTEDGATSAPEGTVAQ